MDRKVKLASKMGCEATREIVDLLNHSKEAKYQHLQLTIPCLVDFKVFDSISNRIDLIAHSNCLNTQGNNSWDDLKLVKEQILSMSPKKVVEHYTAFLDEDGRKGGVQHRHSNLDQHCANIEKWQNILGMKIGIENIPDTDNPIQYFEDLLEVSRRTSCEITVDVAHALISMTSLEKTERVRFIELLKLVNPSHIHLSSVVEKNGVLWDNHYKVVSELVWELAELFIDSVEFVTFEQNSNIKSIEIENAIDDFLKFEPKGIDTLIDLKITNFHSNEEFNVDAGKNIVQLFRHDKPVMKNSSYGSTSETSFKWMADPLEHLNLNWPLNYSVDTIKKSLDKKGPEFVVEMLISACRHGMAMQSWWKPNDHIKSIATITSLEDGGESFDIQISPPDREEIASELMWKVCGEHSFVGREFSISIKSYIV